MDSILYIVWFFVKTFLKGCMLGVVFRFIIALFTKSDVSWVGLLRTALVVAVLYTLLIAGYVGRL